MKYKKYLSKPIVKNKKTFKQKYNELLNSKDEEYKNTTLLKLAPYIHEYSEAIIKNDTEKITKYTNLMNGILHDDISETHSYDNNCVSCNITLQEDKSEDYCPNCGLVSKFGPKFVVTPKFIEQTGFSISTKVKYKKTNHFLNILNKFQSHYKLLLPDKVYEDIKNDLDKQRRDYSTLKPKHIKETLKKLKYNKYYDASIDIIRKLNNQESFYLTPDLKNKLVELFEKIDKPWMLFKDPKRKNNLPFNYVINKFFKILKLDEYCDFFPLLKSHEKLREHDIVFKKIITWLQENDNSFEWVFIPSI